MTRSGAMGPRGAGAARSSRKSAAKAAKPAESAAQRSNSSAASVDTGAPLPAFDPASPIESSPLAARGAPAPIRRLTMEQFAALFQAFAADPGSRAIVEVHLHHTWRPRCADFRGIATLEAMRRVHMEVNRWSDIAQHVTIDPVGGLWTGRSWNEPPASSVGHNGTARRGPFMLEMIGDFDVGQDAFDGVRKAAAIEAVATIIVASQATGTPITSADVKFHHELDSPKTCPGTSIDKAELVRLIDQRVAALTDSRPRGAPGALAVQTLQSSSELFRALTQRADATRAPDPLAAPEAVTESEAVGDLVGHFERVAMRSAAPGTDRFAVRDARARVLMRWSELRAHVVNLAKGRLSTGGEFEMDSGSIAAILDGVRGYARTTESPRLMLWAHGGLVSEADGLAYARATRAWWLQHGVYPVYFVWETGFLETVTQAIGGARGVADLWDAVVERVVRPIGLPTWTAIKASARLSSAPDTGEGWPGGAWQFVDALVPVLGELADAGRALSVHAVGHSAGSIFHGHLLPELAARGVSIASLSLLAPAIRVDRFRASLEPLRTSGKLGALHVFTMCEEAELADTVGPYLKSLLYLVSRTCEPKVPTPILGLQESIDADAALHAFLASHAEVQYAWLPDQAPNPLCQAQTHGGFDDDRFTVGAVLRRIKGVPDAGMEGTDDFPEEASARARLAATPYPTPAARGRRMALCVGIDRYAERPLAGCVADANAWARALGRLGFDVQRLFDEGATRGSILGALEGMIRAATPGDSLVFQYSGHGTQVEDLDADENDGYDEAFVPIDYGAGRLLLDDDVATIAARVPAGVVLTLFMDCCHAGTISRFAPPNEAAPGVDERVRYLPLSRTARDAHVAFRRSLPAGARPAPEESLPGVVHFAACRDHEYAWESQGQGDFTRAAIALIGAAVAQAETNESFGEAVAAEVGKRGRQHPALMRLPANLRDRPLLAGREPRDAETDHSGSVAGADDGDAALLALAESLVTALRARVGG